MCNNQHGAGGGVRGGAVGPDLKGLLISQVERLPQGQFQASKAIFWKAELGKCLPLCATGLGVAG